MYSPDGISLVQKLGGWSKFYPSPIITNIVRALWAWQDLNLNEHLAFGTDEGLSTESQLAVITGGVLEDITPWLQPTPLFAPELAAISTIAGSATVVITDFETAAYPITSVNSVYIATQIAVGGLILFGSYACDPDGFV